MKAIIFDFDGVIHDTFELGYKIKKIIDPNFTEEDYRNQFEGNILQLLKQSPPESFSKFRVLEHEAFKELKIEREIREELEHLSKKYELYIVTSNTAKNLNMYFENNNFTGIFMEVMAEETHISKVEKFKMIFSKYGLDNESCIFVTDTVGDVLEANKVGLKSIACTFGFHKEDRLKKVNPYRTVSKFHEIRKIMEDL